MLVRVPIVTSITFKTFNPHMSYYFILSYAFLKIIIDSAFTFTDATLGTW